MDKDKFINAKESLFNNSNISDFVEIELNENNEPIIKFDEGKLVYF